VEQQLLHTSLKVITSQQTDSRGDQLNTLTIGESRQLLD